MTTVRPLEMSDVDAVVARVVDRLALDARLQPLVNPLISTELLEDVALRGDRPDVGRRTRTATSSVTSTARCSRVEPYGNGVWIGPDGVSFDSTDMLSDLYSVAGAYWIERGALEHYVWTIDDVTSTQPWYEMGFARMHMRGVLRLEDHVDHPLPEGYTLRRGGVADIEIAVALDDELDAVQRVGPSFSDRARPLLEARRPHGEPRRPRGAPLHRGVRRTPSASA